MVNWIPSLQTIAIGLALIPGSSAWDRDSVAASRKEASPLTSGIIPGRYIVELNGDSALGQRDVRRRAETVVGDLESAGYEVNIKEDYSSISGRFQGVSIEISNDQEGTLDELKDLSGVADAWPVEIITLDVDFDTSDPSPKWNPHVATRVDELHKRGLKGEGQRVCVVDSGADSSHPALSGRIAGGKNMFDDSTNLEDCNGHGTFVSSMIVGKNKDFSGVAPEAEVFMYKVFGCESSTSNDIILKALLAADADDCDIVSLSLGGDNGYHGSLMSRVASQVAEDRLVIIAAGNAGEMGPFYASSPASGRGVVAVASVNSKQILGWPAVILSSSGESFNLSYVTPDGSKLNESISVPLTFDTGDSCNAKEYGEESEAVVIKRGICFGNGQFNTMSFTGFGYILIFDSYNQGVSYMSEASNTSPSVHLFAVTQAAVGDWVKEQTSGSHTLTFVVEADADTAAEMTDFPASGQMSSFSSWGPTFENDFIPTIAAPGGAVYGAFPDNTFAIASGTSFATPYMAGIAALFFAHVKKDAAEFARRISSTAALLPSYSASEASVISDIAPLAQQGAGLVDAVKVFDYETVLLSESHISLNDTDNRVSTHTIQLKNTGSSQVTFQISHVAASSVQGRDEYWYPYLYYPPLLDAAGSIDAPESVSIAAGATQEVQVTINAPADLAPNSGVIWSGKIVFEGSNGEFLTVPYMGVEASTYNWTPLEGSPLVFRYDSDSGYLYPVDWQGRAYKPAELDSPEIYFALRYGTYEFSLDLVGEDWTKEDFSYPLSAGSGSKQWRGSVRSQPDVFGGYTNFPLQHPLRFNNVGFNRFQCFANGTDIPTGKYRVLSRALRMFGNPTDPNDWQLFLSDAFTIQLGDDTLTSSTSTVTSTTEISTPTIASVSTTTNDPTTTDEATTTDAPTTTTETALATSTAVPGITTTLRAKSSPTGIANAFADISIQRQGTTSNDMYDPSEWMQLHVQMKIPTRLVAGSVASFALPPQIVDVAQNNYVSASGSNVGAAAFDNVTSIYTITFGDWVDWHSDITGDFYLYCRLDPEFQVGLEAGTYFMEIETVGKTFYPPVYYRAVDRSRVYERKHVEMLDDQQVFYFNIEVPGQLGPWKSVTFVSSQASGDDGYLCAKTTVEIGTEFDTGNQITESRDVSTDAIQRCEVKTFKAVYSSEIAEDEVLAFNVANILGNWDSWTITFAYSLAIELTNGTTVGYDLRTLSYDRYARSTPDNWFEGVRDTTGPIIGGPTSTTSTALPSSTLTLSTTFLTTPIANTTVVTTSATTSLISDSTTSLISDSTTDALTPTQYGTTTTPQTDATSTVLSSSSPSSTSVDSTTTEESSETTLSTSTSSSAFSTSVTTSAGSSTSLATSLTGESTGTSTTSTHISDCSTCTKPTSSSASGSNSMTGSLTPSSTPGGVDTTTDSLPVTSTTGKVNTETYLVPGTSTPGGVNTETYLLPETSTAVSTTEQSQETQLSTAETDIPVPSSAVVSSVTKYPSGTTITQSVTIITSVCSEPGWTAPVTVTVTVPCASSGETDFTTVTSVCTRCAAHPVTITYTQPVQTYTQPVQTYTQPAQAYTQHALTASPSSNIVISSGHFSIGSTRPTTVSQVPNQVPSVTIPSVDNYGAPKTSTRRQEENTTLISHTLSRPTTVVEEPVVSEGNSATAVGEATTATGENNEGVIPTSEAADTLAPSATVVTGLGTQQSFDRITYISLAAIAALILTL